MDLWDTIGKNFHGNMEFKITWIEIISLQM